MRNRKALIRTTLFVSVISVFLYGADIADLTSSQTSIVANFSSSGSSGTVGGTFQEIQEQTEAELAEIQQKNSKGVFRNTAEYKIVMNNIAPPAAPPPPPPPPPSSYTVMCGDLLSDSVQTKTINVPNSGNWTFGNTVGAGTNKCFVKSPCGITIPSLNPNRQYNICGKTISTNNYTIQGGGYFLPLILK